MSRDQILACIFGFSSYYLGCICISLPAPFLPKESEKHGQTEAVTGLMMGFMSLVQTLLNPVWGRLSVTIGIRRSLKCGTLISGITTAAFGCLQFIQHDYTTAYTVTGFTIRAIQAAGIAAIFTTVFTLITEGFPEHNTFMLSLTGTLGGVGVMSGPAIGGGLFVIGGFWVVFVCVGGLMVLLSITMFIFFAEPSGSKFTSEKTELPYQKIFLDTRLLMALSVGFFSSIKWSAIDPILEPELRHKYGFVESQSALVFLMLSGAYVIATPIAGKTVGQSYCMDSLMVMVIGLAVSACSFLFAGPSPLIFIPASSRDLWVLLTCLAVMGITNCLLYVPAQDITFNIDRLNLPADINKTAVRGLLSGVWNSAYCFGTFCGMALSGFLGQHVGWAWTMTIYAMSCIFFIIIIVIIKLREITTGYLLRSGNISHSERCIERSSSSDGERLKLLSEGSE